ncbi:BgTH12-06189 [Blumeria graminis f. sp. triticale]|nr:BgTH12-06189 [Blumeria graminis f. sp. triticale]
MPVLAIEDYQCGDLRVEGTVVAEQVKEQYSMTLQRPGAGRFSRDKHFGYAYFLIKSSEPDSPTFRVRVSFGFGKSILGVEYEVDDIYYACRPGPSVR